MSDFKVWYGPYTLNDATVDSFVAAGYSGVYVLGYYNSTGGMDIRYVGRSDEDLNSRLHQWVKEYTLFHFLYCESPEQAYWYECENYHLLPQQGNKLDNSVHPAKPESFQGYCHHCGQ